MILLSYYVGEIAGDHCTYLFERWKNASVGYITDFYAFYGKLKCVKMHRIHTMCTIYQMFRVYPFIIKFREGNRSLLRFDFCALLLINFVC